MQSGVVTAWSIKDLADKVVIAVVKDKSTSQITIFMGSTWVPPGSCRPQVGPMLAPWTLLSGLSYTELTKTLPISSLWMWNDKVCHMSLTYVVTGMCQWDDICLADCNRSCQNKTFHCSQWQNNWQNYDISQSLFQSLIMLWCMQYHEISYKSIPKLQWLYHWSFRIDN